MSSGNYRVLALSMIIILLKVSMIFAGTTGKIAGRVTDRDTGEPLFGVNVIVLGTNLGAATDFDGYYAILNVPPGVQKLSVSMIGYSTVIVNEVRVRIDETSPVDVQLVSQAFETGSITVVAERNLIKQDVSTSVTAVQPDEIQSLPVASINEVISLQAGVEDGLIIRGGKSDGVLFQMDGATMRDPRNNKPISSIALSSIQEVSIERGGFNAEYGQVRSGIINIVSREGSTTNYYGAIQTRYSPATPKHYGISVYDPNSMWNRPYLDPEVCWTGTESGAWNIYEQRQYPKFEGWNSVSEGLLTDDDPTNDLSPSAAQKVWMYERRRRPAIEPDYSVDASFGGPVPIIGKDLGKLRFFSSFRLEKEMLLIPLSRPDYKEYTFSFKINSDVNESSKLQLIANMGKTFNVAMNRDDVQFASPTWGINGLGQQYWSPTNYIRTPYQIAEVTNEQRPSRIFCDSWYSQAEVNHFTLSGKYTSFINSSTYYEVSFEHVGRQYETGPIAQRNLTKNYEVVPGYFVDEAPFGFDPSPTTGLTGMFYGGHSSTIRDSSKLNSYLLKGDLVSQVTKEHMIKGGVEVSYYDLNLDYGSVNLFFNDINYVKEQWKPYRVSAYIQDKIEALGFIANLGLRMDLSNPNTNWVNADPFDESFFSSGYSTANIYPEETTEVDVSFSPRLGISLPITEDSKLYFNYGHFKQMPAYEEIFRIGRAKSGNMLSYGNPGLVQAKTVSYELGYDHVLLDEYLIQLAAFYNDITNQQAYTQYVSDRKGIGYFVANNNSYQDIRGLELTFKKTHGDWVRGFVNYTYQIVTSGAFGKQVINEDPGQQKILDQNTLVLYQQKPIPQPRANLSLTFFSPGDFGPTFLGIQPFGDISVDLLATWQSGEYITYNPNNIPLREIYNNLEVVDYFSADMRINKSFDFESFKVMLFVDISNLFDIKRLSGASFYDGYDQQYYFQSLHLPESKAYNNIPGEDRAGDVRKDGIPYQPIEQYGNVSEIGSPNTSVIYYESSTKRYMNYVNGNWSEVDSGKMQQILDDKAYIDMPNNSSFDFLNPRQIYFGINLSFNL
ncbi:MAG: carboxypeptidase-like regulatory domain-containing protein [bacterium]